MVFSDSLYLKKNVGPIDQVIRLVLGILLVTVPTVLQWSPWSIAILSAVGGAQILEGLIAY